MKLNLSLLAILFMCSSVYGQDKIYKNNTTVIECKITEIGINEIKYKIAEDEIVDSPVIAISVTEVTKVVLSNGREIEFKDPLTNPESYADNKKHAIKLHFLSPLTESLAFSYEKSLKPGRSFESELGIIGVGFDTDEYSKSSGVFIASGIKFLRTPDFYSQRMKYSHILKGGYIKPQVILSIYNYQSHHYGYYNSYDIDKDIVAGAFLVNIGKQIIFDNFFLIDYSVGLGYGFSNQKRRYSDDYYVDYDNFRAYHYGFLLGDRSFPIAATAKLKIGILIK